MKNSLRPGLCHVRPSMCFWKILGVFQHAQFKSLALTPSYIYILARDQAVFKALFFAGDRASDLLGLKRVDIRRFPDN